MTFTEAAVEVLRLVGKPLHYKKITEIAIERNLLSHVGKTPEITMSSRLATMVKKDRGEAPIVKVKPGVFGLREFSADVLKAAESESGHDYELPEEAVAEPREAPASAATATEEKSGEEGGPRLPGADVFPEEEDDDEPILGKLDQDDGADRNGAKRSRKRRRRKGKSGGERGDERRPDEEQRTRRGGDDKQQRSRRKETPSRPASSRTEVKGDWDRGAGDAEPRGQDLAEAIESVLSAGRRRAPMSHADVAAQLVKRGRLTGEPAALAPTVAAAVWGDNARQRGEGRRARFRTVPAGIALVAWDLPTDAVRAEQELWRAADRQREAVHRMFLRRLSDMPLASFMELVAGWLNAEGVAALRGVRPPVQGGYHLAGTLRSAGQETGLGIAIYRDGTALGREHVIEVRGALHHYGSASAAWLVTTGRVQSGAREEAAASGQAPCVVVDGSALALAMERKGIGVRRAYVPMSVPDLDLLESLSPTSTSERAPASKGRDASSEAQDEAAVAGDDKAASTGASDEETSDEGSAEARPKRRRRRRGSRGARSEGESTTEATDTTAEATDAETTKGAETTDTATTKGSKPAPGGEAPAASAAGEEAPPKGRPDDASEAVGGAPPDGDTPPTAEPPPEIAGESDKAIQE